jgi:hypothetical protein
MALIVAGTSLAMAGVVRGKLALLREPLQTPVNEQPLFLKNLRDSDAAKAAVEGGDTPSENGTQPTN